MSRRTPVPTQSRPAVAYGTLTRSGRPFQRRSADGTVAHSAPGLPARPVGRPTPAGHRRQPVPPDGFGLLPVRSPLLGESSLFLGVLRCFSSPGAPRPPMCSAAGARASPRAGCPIRTSADLCLPAAPRGLSRRGHVLLRPQTPRHPPCALLGGPAPRSVPVLTDRHGRASACPPPRAPRARLLAPSPVKVRRERRSRPIQPVRHDTLPTEA